MKPGKMTTEFHVTWIMVAIWAVKYLGFDAYITPENINQVAEAVKAGNASGFDAPSLVGLAYVIGRPLVKILAANKERS